MLLTRHRCSARRALLLRRRPALPQAARPAGAHLHHSTLKSALKHAVREEEIQRNVRTGTSRPRRFEPLTADETRQFLVSALGQRLRALSELALYTGLRKGELLGLRREDLDLKRGHRRHRRTFQCTSAGGLTALPTKPRASECRIAHTTRCFQPLKHCHEQQREREASGTTWQSDGHVSATVLGRPIDPTSLTRALTTLLRKARLRRIRIHDLRHSTATLLLEQGGELARVRLLPPARHPRRPRRRTRQLGEAAETAHSVGDEPPPFASLIR
ncbi:site-specific integrase [Streptomyces goshikiensis]|uniref:site-specific integrase n=1 Tax=Streptomyces TaxID=1883 RepID=UPI0039A64583